MRKVKSTLSKFKSDQELIVIFYAISFIYFALHVAITGFLPRYRHGWVVVYDGVVDFLFSGLLIAIPIELLVGVKRHQLDRLFTS